MDHIIIIIVVVEPNTKRPLNAMQNPRDGKGNKGLAFVCVSLVLVMQVIVFVVIYVLWYVSPHCYITMYDFNLLKTDNKFSIQ
jgi:hypothetical protein